MKDYPSSPNERKAQRLLFDFLNSDEENALLFIDCLPNGIDKWFKKNLGKIVVKSSELTLGGGEMDLVLYTNKKAILLELKIGNAEYASQYSVYSKHLRKMGYSVKVVGILSNKDKNFGLAAVPSRFVTDARFSWKWILTKMLNSRNNEDLENLIAELEDVYEDVFKPHHPRCFEIQAPFEDAKRSLIYLKEDPGTFELFYKDLMEFLPICYESLPSQSGNSPPLLMIGRKEWANWFDDDFQERIVLNFDNKSKRSKALGDMRFEFNIGIFHKSFGLMGGGGYDLKKYVYFCDQLHRRGFRIDRNPPNKWRSIPNFQDLQPPYDFDKKGLYWINAFDVHNYERTLNKVKHQGWRGFMDELIKQINRLDELISTLIRDY